MFNINTGIITLQLLKNPAVLKGAPVRSVVTIAVVTMKTMKSNNIKRKRIFFSLFFSAILQQLKKKKKIVEGLKGYKDSLKVEWLNGLTAERQRRTTRKAEDQKIGRLETAGTTTTNDNGGDKWKVQLVIRIFRRGRRKSLS